MQVDKSYEVEPAGPGTFPSPNRETTFFQFYQDMSNGYV